MALQFEGVVDVVDGEEETVAETGECTVIPKALPSPKLPSRPEVEHHNLAHIPDRSWCPICVAARRKNNAHCSGQEEERTVPLLCADYCFVCESSDDDLLSVLIGRIYPSTSLVAVPCERKCHDPYTVHRMTMFMRSNGISNVLFKSDQELAIRRLLDDVVAEATKTGDVFGEVPEMSAVGKSQHNDRAEGRPNSWRIRCGPSKLDCKVGLARRCQSSTQLSYGWLSMSPV